MDILNPNDVESEFNSVDSTRAQALVDAAQNHIENYINTNIFHQDETEEFEGRTKNFILDIAPVKEGSVTITDQKNGSNPDTENYRIFHDVGAIEHKRTWDHREFDQLWKVEYTGGLASDASSLDGSIKEAAWIIIENLQSNDNRLQSETIGDYKYKKKNDAIEDAKMLLEQYRRPRL